MTIKDIYTKDNTILTPNGNEYADLNFALKAYNLSIDEFNIRLPLAKDIRELFCGLDYKCGLKYDLDGTIHDFNGNKYKNLDEMCEYYHADKNLFESLYSLNVDLKTCLLQPTLVKENGYIEKLKMEKEKKDKEAKIALQEKKEEQDRKDKALQRERKRLQKAKLVFEKYFQLHVLGEKSFTRERATQIVQLSSLISSHRAFTSNERRLVNRAKIALETKTAITSDRPDVNRELVKSILGDIPYKYIDSSRVRISDKVKLKEVVTNAIQEKSKLEKSVITPTLKTENSLDNLDKKNLSNNLAQPLDVRSIMNAKKEEEKNKKDIERKSSLDETLKSQINMKTISNKDGIQKRVDKQLDYDAIQLETIRILKAYLGQ